MESRSAANVKRGFTSADLQTTAAVANAACVHYHTPHPEGYLAHAAWAERMLKTHRQARCAWCGLWAVWIPKRRKVANKAYQLEMEAKAA